LTKKGEDPYEDFYERAFSDVDVQKILEAGGFQSIKAFFQESKGHTKNNDYWKAMWQHPKRKEITGVYYWNRAKEKKTLGRCIYEKFFEQQDLTLNSAKRVIVAKGYTIKHSGKTYKGGMFVPKSLIQKR